MSSASAPMRSSSSLAPRGYVPAIGRVSTRRPVTATWAPVKRQRIEASNEEGGWDDDCPQAAVDRKRLHRHLREALRRHDLEGVAGVDVLDDPGHAGLELPRVMFDSNTTSTPVGLLRFASGADGVPGGRGTGRRSASRVSAISRVGSDASSNGKAITLPSSCFR